MREHLYRAWIKSQNRYADEVEIICDSERNTTVVAWYGDHPDHIGGDDIILEQYTGLKDKNGKRIFEGDIIRDEEKFHYAVSWNEKNMAWEVDGDWLGDFQTIELEVIGNIHEGGE
jgi:uncharacterized phage protein (TIGR01671 family)